MTDELCEAINNEYHALAEDLQRVTGQRDELLAVLSRITNRATRPLSDGGIDWDDVTAARELIARVK